MGTNTHFVASQGQCNMPNNTTMPCCRADFNKVNGITAQDIYDYLEAWFAQSPDADYLGNGTGAPSQASINAFINAWFAGGC